MVDSHLVFLIYGRGWSAASELAVGAVGPPKGRELV